MSEFWTGFMMGFGAMFAFAVVFVVNCTKPKR